MRIFDEKIIGDNNNNKKKWLRDIKQQQQQKRNNANYLFHLVSIHLENNKIEVITAGYGLEENKSIITNKEVCTVIEFSLHFFVQMEIFKEATSYDFGVKFQVTCFFFG